MATDNKDEQQKQLKDFGNRLHSLREDSNYSLGDLEEISKNIYHQRVARGTWSKYERGEIEPGLTKLKMIASIFNVTLDYLIGLTDKPDGRFEGEKKENKLRKTQVSLLAAYDKASEKNKSVTRKLLGVRNSDKEEK